MKTLARFCLTFLLVTTFIHQLHAQLNGRVFITDTKDPVKNAAVAIIDIESNKTVQKTKTDEAGNFKLASISSKRYRIEVSKLFYETYISPEYTSNYNLRSSNTPLIIYLKTSVTVSKPVIDTPATEVLIERKLKDQRIFRNKDAYDLIYALNPNLDPQKPIPSNYPLVLPKFPKPNRTVRKEFRKAHKAEVKVSRTASATFISTGKQFSEQVLLFSGSEIKPANGISSSDLFNLKSSLTSVNNRLASFTSKAKRTSKGTISFMNRELLAIVQVLRKSNTEKRITSEALKKCNALLYSLAQFFDLLSKTEQANFANDHFVYVQLNEIKKRDKWKIVPATLITNSETNTITSKDTYNSAGRNSGLSYFSGANKPKAFNIYVFIIDPVTGKAKNSPEEKIFNLTYYPPELEELPINPGNLPASVATATIPPARFIFLIEDVIQHTRFSCIKSLDNETTKDDNSGWSLFRKRPYKLIFFINTCQ